MDPSPHARKDFYPRSPRGERPGQDAELVDVGLFLSTLPARGATRADGGTERGAAISIHAPREGSDVLSAGGKPGCAAFLSTLPARGATAAAS